VTAQLADYRHVIGTLWSVDDLAAAEIAVGFYAHLTTQGITPPAPGHSAHALHHATRDLRGRYPNTHTHWGAHTHTGT
jgi:CHAT domain-containing protein